MRWQDIKVGEEYAVKGQPSHVRVTGHTRARRLGQKDSWESRVVADPVGSLHLFSVEAPGPRGERRLRTGREYPEVGPDSYLESSDFVQPWAAAEAEKTKEKAEAMRRYVAEQEVVAALADVWPALIEMGLVEGAAPTWYKVSFDVRAVRLIEAARRWTKLKEGR